MGLSEISEAAGRAAAMASRQLLVAVASTIFGLTAFGFATAALYIAISSEVGALRACIAVAVMFAAVAVALRVNSRPVTSRQPATTPPPREDAIQHLVSTFVAGVGAGREIGKRRSN